MKDRAHHSNSVTSSSSFYLATAMAPRLDYSDGEEGRAASRSDKSREMPGRSRNSQLRSSFVEIRDQHGFPAQVPPTTTAQTSLPSGLGSTSNPSESAVASSSTTDSNGHADNDHSHTHIRSNADANTNPYRINNPHIYSSVSGPFFVASPVQCLSPESTLTCNGWCERPPSPLLGPLPDVVSYCLSALVGFLHRMRILTDKKIWWRWRCRSRYQAARIYRELGSRRMGV